MLSASHSSVMSVSTFGLISDARARQRRRQILIVAAVISAGIAGGRAFIRSGIPLIGSPASASAESVAPAAVLSSAPSMGVACYRHSCDWVGLAVRLRRPAIAVTATVAGQPVRLQPSNAYPRPGAKATFAGFLRHYQRVTSIRLETVPGAPTAWNLEENADTQWPWEDGEAPLPWVQLRIRSSSGAILVTHLRVPLQPGWG